MYVHFIKLSDLIVFISLAGWKINLSWIEAVKDTGLFKAFLERIVMLENRQEQGLWQQTRLHPQSQPVRMLLILHGQLWPCTLLLDPLLPLPLRKWAYCIAVLLYLPLGFTSPVARPGLSVPGLSSLISDYKRWLCESEHATCIGHC